MQSLIITNSGEELISRLIAETATVSFTKISVSDHDYSGVDLKTLTELEDIKQTALISGITRVDATLIEIVAAMDNTKLETGYYVRTLGVYAKDQDGNEILFGVSIAADTPSYFPPYSGRTISSISYCFNIKVSNSERVNVELKPGAYPTVEQFSELQEIVNSHTHDNCYYTKTETDSKLLNKANKNHTHSASDISDLPDALTVDNALSSTSENPVQNKAVNAALETKLPKTGGTISGSISVTGNISATGNITGSKVYNAVWSADYAEGFDYEGDIPEPGEIVELCGNNKVRIASAESSLVIGVCSNTYWALAGCSIADIENKTKVAVGIAGQLPIKVRGAVKYGDYIVCGGDGIGEARNEPSAGQTVGRAMETNSALEIKRVNCLIQVR